MHHFGPQFVSTIGRRGRQPATTCGARKAPPVCRTEHPATECLRTRELTNVARSVAAAGQPHTAPPPMAPPPMAPQGPLTVRRRVARAWDWANQALAEEWQFNVEFDRCGAGRAQRVCRHSKLPAAHVPYLPTDHRLPACKLPCTGCHALACLQCSITGHLPPGAADSAHLSHHPATGTFGAPPWPSTLRSR